MAVVALILGSIFGIAAAMIGVLGFGVPVLMAAGIYVAFCFTAMGLTALIAVQEDIDALKPAVAANA